MMNKRNPDVRIESEGQDGIEKMKHAEARKKSIDVMNGFFENYRKKEAHSYTMNSQKTIDLISERYKGDDAQKFIHERLEAGTDPHVRLRGTNSEFYMTGNEASGQFLTESDPGESTAERKENLQLPESNNAQDVYKVHLNEPSVVIESTVAPQPEFAQKAGYEAKDGIKQIFVPPKFGDMGYKVTVMEQVKGHTEHISQKNKESEEESE